MKDGMSTRRFEDMIDSEVYEHPLTPINRGRFLTEVGSKTNDLHPKVVGINSFEIEEYEGTDYYIEEGTQARIIPEGSNRTVLAQKEYDVRHLVQLHPGYQESMGGKVVIPDTEETENIEEGSIVYLDVTKDKMDGNWISEAWKETGVFDNLI